MSIIYINGQQMTLAEYMRGFAGDGEDTAPAGEDDLRALLAEAREWLDINGLIFSERARLAHLRARIDEHLAKGAGDGG